MQNTILIVVPTLNSYKLLPNLVNSLKKQTSKYWRLLFVDGNSSCNHRQYIRSLERDNTNISFVKQDGSNKGIYGAMNIGLKFRKQNEWLMFWGSDDYAYDKFTIENIMKIINHNDFRSLDLIFNDAVYIDKFIQKKRTSSFKMISNNLKISFFLGFSPAHQACLFSPKILIRKNNYSLNYYLAADLDYFLSVSNIKNINVKYFPNKLVKISKGGISGNLHKKRLKEVIKLYKKYFGIYFLIPFCLRYLNRFIQYALAIFN